MLRYARASIEDQSKVNEFLNAFPNDYLSDLILRYIKQQPGGLYLAYDEAVIVGIGVITYPKPQEAYLSGMRIAPDRQGQGIGQEFARFQLQEIERFGVMVVRTLVEDGNDVSRQFLEEKLGFRMLTPWHVATIEGVRELPEPSSASGPAWSVDLERLQRFWARHQEDLCSAHDPWVPQSLSLEDIRGKVESGVAAVFPQSMDEPVEALALYTIHNQEQMDLHYLKGNTDSLEHIIRYLGIEARAWGINSLRFGLPGADSSALCATNSITVIQQWQGVVFEKRLSGTSH